MHVFARGPLRLLVPVIICMSDIILFTTNVDDSASLDPVDLSWNMHQWKCRFFSLGYLEMKSVYKQNCRPIIMYSQIIITICVFISTDDVVYGKHKTEQIYV